MGIDYVIVIRKPNSVYTTHGTIPRYLNNKCHDKIFTRQGLYDYCVKKYSKRAINLLNNVECEYDGSIEFANCIIGMYHIMSEDDVLELISDQSLY